MLPRTAAMYFAFISWICHDYIDSFSETDVICYVGTHYQFLWSIWTRSNTTRGRAVKRKNKKKKKSSLPLNQRYLQGPRREQLIYSFLDYLCQTFQVLLHKVKVKFHFPFIPYLASFCKQWSKALIPIWGIWHRRHKAFISRGGKKQVLLNTQYGEEKQREKHKKV